MLRGLLTVLAIGGGSVALADDPTKLVGGRIAVRLVKTENGKLVAHSSEVSNEKQDITDWTGPTPKVVVREVTGRSEHTSPLDLKHLRLTDTANKDVPHAAALERFKDGGFVVQTEDALDPAWKAKFKKGTVFVEFGIQAEPKKGAPPPALDPPPKDLPPPGVKSGAVYTLGHLALKGQEPEFVWTSNRYEGRGPYVREGVIRDGKGVMIDRQVERPGRATERLPVKGWSVFAADDKLVKGDDMAKRFSEPVMAVFAHRPGSPEAGPPEWRKLLADDVLFVTNHSAWPSK